MNAPALIPNLLANLQTALPATGLDLSALLLQAAAPGPPVGNWLIDRGVTCHSSPRWKSLNRSTQYPRYVWLFHVMAIWPM